VVEAADIAVHPAEIAEAHRASEAGAGMAAGLGESPAPHSYHKSVRLPRECCHIVCRT